LPAVMNKTGSRTVGFCDQFVTINFYGEELEGLVDFLCCDLQTGPESAARARYDVMLGGSINQMLSLWLGEQCQYSGECRYELAYTLINEIIYQCIVDNAAGHAIHAAAIGSANGAVLLPGKSGFGKSTLTAWLVSKGGNYLTDELVLLSGKKKQLLPFTRPFSMKAGSSAILNSFVQYKQKDTISGVGGFMLPHRLLNPDFFPLTPALSLILFPEYREGAATELNQLSSALGCAKLMECYVNARNIEGLGIDQLADYTRNTPVFQLVYGSFDGLYEQLHESFPLLF